MSHPTNYWKRPFFYGIGNTPAVCLTQDLTPEEAANILLLGCGDPRSILYTIYSIGEEGPFNLDFTCCDLDPAVLARNVLLLTLLADDTAGNNDAKIWNIFYHFYIDKDSLTLLLTHSQKLFELSDSIKTWNNSQYGSFLRMCTQKTLSQLRGFWGLYAKTGKMTNAEKTRFRNKYDSGLKEVAKQCLPQGGQNITSARSAGPLWMAAVTPTAQEFTHFWKTGVTTVDQQVFAASTLPNPTFAYSARGEVFAVHYGADPISGFHLAPAFVPIKASPQPKTGEKSFQHIVDLCQTQFRDRGKAFRLALSAVKKAGKLVIRVFCGDALALCKALNYWAVNSSIETGMYAASWTISQLILDGGDYIESSKIKAPLNFNVIDTSNLTDHLGILNILVVTVPLLPRAPSSVLYTETLLSSGADPATSFVERMCADIPAISILLGVAPLTYVSNFTSHSNVHEILAANMRTGQFHERIAWKVVSLGDPIAAAHDSDCNRPLTYEADPLAKFIFAMYLQMFQADNAMSKFRKVTIQDIAGMALVHYNRGSLAALMRLIKARTKTSWQDLMDGIHGRIQSDRQIPMGLNNYQALTAQIHLLNVDTDIPVLKPNQRIIPINTKTGKLGGWGNVPPLVCVVLTVPRHALKVLTDFDMARIGSPTLKCEVGSPHGHNVIYDFHPIFGSATATGSKEYTSIRIKEDPTGWSGTSPLILSFWYPAWQLMIYPHETTISFGVRSSPHLGHILFMKALGPAMNIYNAKLDDKNVLVARERPNLPGEAQKVNAISLSNFSTTPTTTPVKISPVSVNLDASGQRIVTLAMKVDIIDKDLKAKLAGKTDVTTSQPTPCTIEVKIDSFSQPLAFPFPIDGTRAKLRIARKSSYVEVIVPISTPRSVGGFSTKSFPVVMHNKAPLAWNIHYLNLDRLPAIDISDPSKLTWMDTHIGLMLSDRERNIRDTMPGYSHKDIIFDVKDSIAHIIIQYAGIKGNKSQIFALSDPEKGGIYTLIFCTDIRLDVASHTVVLDACILPLTPKLLATSTLLDTIFKFHNSSKIVDINTAGEESKAWRDLSLAFIERCRRWKHREDCHYLTKGIPLTYDSGKPLQGNWASPASLIFHDDAQIPPLCACAPGKASPEFLKVKEWEPFAKHVTRIAISPLFAVSYLDPVGQEFGKMMSNDWETMENLIKKEGCYNCGKGGGGLLRCARCKKASYCSAECQKADWKKHKQVCR